MNKRYMRSVDSLWAPVAKHVAELPKDYHEGEVYSRYMEARHGQVDLLTTLAPVIRNLLTAEQRRQLPSIVTSYMDPRYLALIRNGTATFLAGGGGFGPMMLGGDVMGGATFNMTSNSGGTQTVIIRQ
jgi:hypothetical protein